MTVRLERVTFGYRVDEPIVNSLDFSFSAGQMSAVTGASGRGKSTLLYLIGLLVAPWSGQIDVGAAANASALGDAQRSALRASRIGFVFQDALLDPARTVLDNVVEGALYAGIPRTRALRDARGLLERFGVRLRADHRPGEVSGGQAQRVALCRAFLTQPQIILADEPTGNLDPTSAEVVVDALRDAAHKDGATVIVATHDERIVAVCERVLVL